MSDDILTNPEFIKAVKNAPPEWAGENGLMRLTYDANRIIRLFVSGPGRGCSATSAEIDHAVCYWLFKWVPTHTKRDTIIYAYEDGGASVVCQIEDNPVRTFNGDHPALAAAIAVNYVCKEQRHEELEIHS